MDRLVCGDVGFGKTEVAVRAIYLAACAGRQSALLVPSIVVAGLHADALRARLPTEVCIEVLTRKTKLETLLQEPGASRRGRGAAVWRGPEGGVEDACAFD